MTNAKTSPSTDDDQTARVGKLALLFLEFCLSVACNLYASTMIRNLSVTVSNTEAASSSVTVASSSSAVLTTSSSAVPCSSGNVETMEVENESLCGSPSVSTGLPEVDVADDSAHMVDGDDENRNAEDFDNDDDDGDDDEMDEESVDVDKSSSKWDDSAFDETFPDLSNSELRKRIDESVISPNVADALDVDQHFSRLSLDMQGRIRFMLSLDSEPSAKATLRCLRGYFKDHVPTPVPLMSSEVAAFKSMSNPVVLLLKGTHGDKSVALSLLPF